LDSYLLPEFVKSLNGLDHFDTESFIRVHALGEQPVSVHMNTVKPVLTDGGWPSDFIHPPFELAGKVPWAADSYYLSQRPSFTLDPLFHAGTYYVQEASGMFLSFVLSQITDLTKKMKVLDLCAAPGGKSTLIQSLISPESLLVSNEVIKTRVPVLTQNMIKWGRSNGIVSNNDPSHFKELPGFFDIVVIDAPCSGSGLYRKDPEAAASWTPDLVNLCSQRQQRILADAWSCLKEGGYLIYSTCSYSKEENEDVLDVHMQQYEVASVPLFPDRAWNIVETISEKSGAFGYRFYPDKVTGEGFFISVLQKTHTGLEETLKNYSSRKSMKSGPGGRSGKNPLRVSRSASLLLNPWIQAEQLELITIGESIHAMTPGLLHDLELLKNNLYLKKAGIRVGKEGENEWIPDHELALADFLNKDCPTLNISKSDALLFLKGESFEAGVSGKGWHVVCYRNQRLGWVKLLERRMNNYYPKSWRIRQ